MNRRIITISDSRTVSVADNVKMNIPEIADLFGIYYQTAKRLIRSIEKTDIAGGDNSMGGTLEGMKIYPDYYGLEMIVALSFLVDTEKRKYSVNG